MSSGDRPHLLVPTNYSNTCLPGTYCFHGSCVVLYLTIAK